jgi:hypothetical protein
MSKRSSLGSAYHYISVSLLSLVSFFPKKSNHNQCQKLSLGRFLLQYFQYVAAKVYLLKR